MRAAMVNKGWDDLMYADWVAITFLLRDRLKYVPPIPIVSDDLGEREKRKEARAKYEEAKRLNEERKAKQARSSDGS